MNRIISNIFLITLFTFSASVFAEDPTPRTITVSGEAEVKAMPDQVLVTLGLETRHKQLNEVKRINDQKMKDVLVAITALGIPSKDIQSDYLNLQPEYDYPSAGRVFVGYVQRNTILVTLRDVSKFDSLTSAVLTAGVEYIHGVDFRTTELRKYRDEARALAMKAATDKARALAATVGEKVGKPRSIQEGSGGYWSSYGNWWGRSYQGMTQNVVQNAAPESPREDGPLAPGALSISASVTITFALE